MALLIKVTHEGDPVPLAPVELFFDQARRYERHTNEHGEIYFEPCPGHKVHVTVDGVSHGDYTCPDQGMVAVEI